MSFSFVVAYLVVGGLTKTLIVPLLYDGLKWFTSFESQECQLSTDI